MEETKQESVSDKYYDEIFGNIDELKEKFIHFYGEKYRQKIENLFRITDFIIVPNYLETYEFIKHIHKNFPHLEKFNINQIIAALNWADMALSNNDQKGFEFINSSPVIEALGINIKDYVTMSDGKYSWISEDLKKEFFGKYSKVIGNLNLDRLLVEESISFHDEFDDEEYMSEVEKIKSEQQPIIEDIIERVAENHCDKTNGVDQEQSRKAAIEAVRQIFEDCKKYFDKNMDTDAFYESHEIKERLRVVVQTGKVSLSIIIHEMNHMIQTWINTDQKEPCFESGVDIETSQNQRFNKPMNEMINEYISQRVIEEEFADAETEIPKQSINGCGYNSMMKLFDKFLRKWEPVLKETGIGKDPLGQLREVIGETNFEKLSELCHYFFVADEGKYLSELSKLLNKPINSFEDVLKNIDEINALDLNYGRVVSYDSNLAKYVRVVQQASQLSELLAEHFEEFTKKNTLGIRKKPIDLTEKLIESNQEIYLPDHKKAEELALKHEE